MTQITQQNTKHTQQKQKIKRTRRKIKIKIKRTSKILIQKAFNPMNSKPNVKPINIKNA